MFCDWRLHIELSRNKEIKKFLGEFDEAIGRMESGYGPIDVDYLSFKKFKEAMKEFLKEFGLPDNILESGRWPQFVRLYSGVVSDCPVTHKNHPFKFIKEIRINIRQPDSASADYKKQREGFYLQWQVTKNDRNQLRREVLGELA